jgi:hypothetical protein
MEEQMFSKLLLASVAAIGLLLVGPQKASAQVVYACVSSIGNIVMVAANANCPPNVGSATWTKISWNATTAGGTPGPTNLLFTYVTNSNGFDTGLAISNTSADPFNTATQSGTCTLNIYSTGTTPFTYTTPTIAPGTTFGTLMSVIDPGTTGYIFATCTFTYAHGFAFISDIGAQKLAMGYLATVVQTPRPNNENLNN